MAGRHESSAGFFSTIAVVLVVSVAGVIAGMTKIPTFFANRDVQRAVDDVAHELEPTHDDNTIVAAINQHLSDVKASRFWVDQGKQQTSLDLHLTGEQVVVTRDGNRSMVIDVTYAQDMWVPVLGRIDHQTFRVHADSQAAR
jgi:hypothetical protein